MMLFIKNLAKRIPQIRRLIEDLEAANRHVAELQRQLKACAEEDARLRREILEKIAAQQKIQNATMLEALQCMQPGAFLFECNVCGAMTMAPIDDSGREAAACSHCACNTRHRSMIHILTLHLYGKSMTLPSLPARPDISGLGMSDYHSYAIPLASKFNYTNTFYHQEPRLDITDVPRELWGKYDFIISTDVFEHVPPPISTAFANAFRLLKPGGLMVFSVPYSTGCRTLEHFPSLHRFTISEEEPRVLVNTLPDGRLEHFGNLIFHGGAGSTLEMRQFAEADLIGEIARAGFVDITIHLAPVFRHGIYFPQRWSLPMSFRRPPKEGQVYVA